MVPRRHDSHLQNDIKRARALHRHTPPPLPHPRCPLLPIVAELPNRRLWDSAADSGIRRLLIVLPETGVVVDVEAWSKNGNIVLVGDIL